MSSTDEIAEHLTVERFTPQPELEVGEHGDDPAMCAQRCRVLMHALEEFEAARRGR